MDLIKVLEKIEREDKSIKDNQLKSKIRQKIDDEFLKYIQSDFSELTTGINLINYNFLKSQMKKKFREKSSILIWIRGSHGKNQLKVEGIISWAKNQSISPNHLSDILEESIPDTHPNTKKLMKLNDGLKIYNVPAIFYLHKLITGKSNIIEKNNKFLKNSENILIINKKSEEIFKTPSFDVNSLRESYVKNFWRSYFESEKIDNLKESDEIINFITIFFSYYFKSDVHFKDRAKILKDLNYSQIHRDYGLEIARNLYHFFYNEQADVTTFDDEHFFKTLETNDASLAHIQSKNIISEESRLINTTIKKIKRLIVGLYGSSEAEAQKLSENIFNKSYIQLKHHHTSHKLIPSSFAFFFTHYLIFEYDQNIHNDPRPLTPRTLVSILYESQKDVGLSDKNIINEKINKTNLDAQMEYQSFMSSLDENLVNDRETIIKFKTLFLEANPLFKIKYANNKSEEQQNNDFNDFAKVLKNLINMKKTTDPSSISSEHKFWSNLEKNIELFLSCIDDLLVITKIQSEQSKEITKSRKVA